MTELINDPQEINRLAEAFNSVSQEVDIVTTTPPSDTVELPGGYIFPDGTLATTATVRELNGLDEEAIAKAGSINKAMNIILERGLVAIGEVALNKVNLDTLLIGDRDAILLGIRRITFGEQYEFTLPCVKCDSDQTLVFDLTTDVDMVKLDDPVNDRTFTVEAKIGEVTLTLPNGFTNKKILSSENKSYAELVTDVLSGCIVAINGNPSMGRQTALTLGMKDREYLANTVLDRAPGPRLLGVNSACKACGNPIKLSLSLADLFRL